MIYPDGTMDCYVNGVHARRPFTTHQRVARGCVTQNIYTPTLNPGETMMVVNGIPHITTEKKPT